MEKTISEGIIYKALSGFYYVESNDSIIECKARGKLRLENSSPLVGDYVTFMPTDAGKGYLLSINPRKNAFTRPPITNIDKMVIIASAVIPITDPFLIDKMTVVAANNDCEPIICINKCDIDPAERLFNIYSSAGFKVVRTSALTGEGIQYLLDVVSESISAFTGNSGVGKSSILNAMSPEFRIAVNDVSKKLGRGKHTTRHVELFKLPGRAIIADTPGFSAFDTSKLVPKDELAYLFPDFEPYLGGCRFTDCAHLKEPKCAILEALDVGKLQKSRYTSYVRLYEQASEYDDWEWRSK